MRGTQNYDRGRAKDRRTEIDSIPESKTVLDEVPVAVEL